MRTNRRLWMGICLPFILCFLGCAGEDPVLLDANIPATLPAEPVVEAFGQAVNDGYTALANVGLDSALVHFRMLTDLVPRSPYGDYHLACAYGRSGDVEQGIEALKQAVDKGFSDRHRAEEDPDLEALESHATWPELLTDMEANRAVQTKAIESALPHVQPSSEPTFADLDTLSAYYRNEFRSTMRRSRIFTSAVAVYHAGNVTARNVAALKRYGEGHADATDDAEISAAMLQALIRLARVQHPWLLGRKDVVEQAESIRQMFPDSALAGEAALWATRAQTAGLLDMYGEISAKAALPASDAFLATADAYAGSAWEGEALAEAVYYRAKATDGDLAALRPIVERLVAATGGNLRGLERSYEANEFVLRVTGPPAFTASDIDGHEWSLGELHGRVALIDFWATWCGPCVAEIPTLVELSQRYGQDEFLVLGVSLDRYERVPIEDLRTWLAGHEMTWPQIYSGEAWDGTLPRLYNVPAIPFPVLLDRQGNVVAAGGGARGETLKSLVAELLGD